MVTGTRRRPPGFFGGEPRSDSSDTRVSLLRFLGPRYWRSWLLIAWLRAASLLPRRWSLALHKALGRRLGRGSRKATALVDRNLERCFPEMSATERAGLTSEYFANVGAIVAELALVWFRTPESLAPLFTIEGQEHLERALERGRGVILCTGHFTSLEICSIGVGAYAPRYGHLYNNRRSRLLSEIQRRSRERYTDELIHKRNIRGLLRSLEHNSVILFAGDEAHTGKSSAMIPFFGEPALTNLSLSRLARISGAAVVPLFYCRRPDDSGYLIRFSPALDHFPSDDAIADTKRLVALLEEQVLECPAQYFWKQKRFRRRREDRHGGEE